MLVVKSKATLIPNITIALRRMQLKKIKFKYDIDQGELLSFTFRYHQMITPLLPEKQHHDQPTATAYSDPYLRSRYRQIAKHIHPDKAQTPEMEKNYT